MSARILFAMSFGLIACLAAPGEEPQTFDEAYAVVKAKASQITSWTADFQNTRYFGLYEGGAELTSRLYGKGEMERRELVKMHFFNDEISDGSHDHTVKPSIDGRDYLKLEVFDAQQVGWAESEISGEIVVSKSSKANVIKTRKELQELQKLESWSETLFGDMRFYESPLGLLSSYSREYDLKFAEMKDEDGSVFVFEGKRKVPRPSQSDSAIRLAIGAEDGFPRRFESFTSEGDLFQAVRFSDVKVNPELDDDLFVYTPPEGAKVYENK